MNANNYVAIMAGGIGSRFWPASREHRPKQFLDVLGVGKSLLQLTYERFLKICPAENIYIVTNHQYKDLVQEHLPKLAARQILCEPSRNNTAPCVAYTAFRLYSENPKANFVVAPSDHIILKEQAFIDKVNVGLDLVAKEDILLTLGIQPTYANTGYGYIHFDKESEGEVSKVFQFTEKPNLERAESFIESGNYLWNAGIFIWNAASILKAFETHAEDIYQLFEQGKDCYATDDEQTFIDKNYPNSPNISIDYAIMEKANNIYTLPADIGWSDLGTWRSLYEEVGKDEQQNVVTVDNKDLVWCVDTTKCMVRTPQNKLVVIKDLEDYIVVDEDDVLLVYPKAKEQEIKGLTQSIKAKIGKQFS